MAEWGNFAKRQLWFEPVINTWDHIGTYEPSIAGVLKSVRLRYIITGNFTDDFALTMRLVNSNDNTVVVDTSNTLTLDDFTKPAAPFDFHQGWIRFDFDNGKVLSNGALYRFELQHVCAAYNTDDQRFIMFAIDYPLRTYETSGNSDPTLNGYGDIQIYLERRYDDFIER